MPRLLPTVRGVRKALSGSSHRMSRDKSKGDDHKSSRGDHKEYGCASQSTASLTENDADWIVRKTESRIAEVVAKSCFIQKNCRLYKLPRFSLEDIEVEEQLIAHGGFCEVRGIKQFKVSTELDREIVKKQYVIKHLSPKLIGKHRQLAIGAKDLVWEGFVLSSLNCLLYTSPSPRDRG